MWLKKAPHVSMCTCLSIICVLSTCCLEKTRCTQIKRMEQFDWYDDELRLEDLCSDPFNGEYPDPRIDLRDVHVETMTEYDIMKKVVMPFMMLIQTAEENRIL